MSDPRIVSLATQLAEAHELDFSLASLTNLEAIVAAAGGRIARDTTTAWGAYLGETIRRQATVPIDWVDYATASASNVAIANLAPGYDLDAILRIGDAFWFPLSKVEKFQTNGQQDSLVEFAGVVLALAASKSSPERPFDPKSLDGAFVALAEFRKKPSADTLWTLWRMFDVADRDERHALELLGVGADELWPFLSIPASGRGWQRHDAGEVAAKLIAKLVVCGLASRDQVFARARTAIANKDKVARANAVYLLTYCELRNGSNAAFLEYAAQDSKDLASGAWRALGKVTSDWRMERYAQNIAMKPLVPVMKRALDRNSPLLRLALDTINDWFSDWERTRDVAEILDLLIALLDHDKPTVAQDAADSVTHYLWAIVHGSAPMNPAVNVLVERQDQLGAEPLARIRERSR